MALIAGIKYNKFNKNRAILKQLKPVPNKLPEKKVAIPENPERTTPRAKTFGKIARISIAEFFSSKTLNIVGEIIAEKKKSIPNKAEFTTTVIVDSLTFMFFWHQICSINFLFNSLIIISIIKGTVSQESNLQKKPLGGLK